MFGRKSVDKLPFGRRTRKVPLWVVGVIVLGLVGALLYGGVKHHVILDSIRSGHTYQAQFDRQYLLAPALSKVKVAGVPVGTVTGVKQNKQGALVSMKIYGKNGDKLGTEPRAALRITILLGGIVYVQLTPGGAPGHPQGVIPLSRTTTPVYVDSLLSAVPPPAQLGAKKFVNQFQQTFARGGEASTQKLLADAPAALPPATTTLNAFQGNQPGDLTDLVSNLERTDATVTRQQGQIESVVSGLGDFSATLGNNATALQSTAATLGSDLANARHGLSALDTTLHELDITSSLARPSVQHLGQLIVQSQPTLTLAAPVLAELDPFLANLDPLLAQLVPTTTRATTFINQVGGPVIGTVLNPILPELNKVQSTPDEKGPTGKPATLYQEIAYTASGLDGVASYYDHVGHYTPVIVGENQYALVPSKLLNPSDDTCAGEVCPGGGANNGDPTVNNQSTPKSVDPPGLHP